MAFLSIKSLSERMEFKREIAIDLDSLSVLLWGRRWIVLSLTIAFGLLCLVAALVLPKKYEAVIVVSPVSNTSTAGKLGGLASIAGQLGGLASLVGSNISANGDRSESIAVLQSQILTEKYIQENNLVPVLFSKIWDPVRNEWQTNDPQKVPTLWKANELFKDKIRKVTENNKNGLLTLTITWKDPTVAANWANGLVAATNEFLRKKAIDESERHIKYLNEQAAKTDVAEVRSAIYAILETEIKSVMLARGTEEYALKVIDPAIPSEKASTPKPVLWTVIGCFCGFAVSVLILMVTPYRRMGDL